VQKSHAAFYGHNHLPMQMEPIRKNEKYASISQPHRFYAVALEIAGSPNVESLMDDLGNR